MDNDTRWRLMTGAGFVAMVIFAYLYWKHREYTLIIWLFVAMIFTLFVALARNVAGKKDARSTLAADKIVLYMRPGTGVLAILGCLGFQGLSTAMILDETLEAYLSGWLCLAIVTIFLILIIWFLRTDKEILRADSMGMSFGYGSHPQVYWDQIANIDVFIQSKHRSICIIAHDNAILPSDKNIVVRWNRKLSRFLGLPDFLVSYLLLDASPDDIVKAIKLLRKRYA